MLLHAPRFPRFAGIQQQRLSTPLDLLHTKPISLSNLNRGSSIIGRPASRVIAAAVETKTPWWERTSAPNMISVNSTEDLIIQLSQARDKLVIVDFFARWCGSCKALYPKLCKICEANPDILLLKINFDDNKQLCKTLGIKVLPFFHFYRGAEGQVAAFSASVAKVQRLRDAVEEFGPARCSLGVGPVVEQLYGELRKDGDMVLDDKPISKPAGQPAAEVLTAV